jgi:hypothetical protein
MSRRGPELHPADDAQEAYRAFSIAVDRMRQGEQVVALIDPEALRPDPASSSVWLSARLSISELPRLLLPRCDQRCRDVAHDAHAFVVLADIALDVTEPRRPSWWESWNESLQRAHRAHHVWYAGAPILPDTPPWRRLRAGTRLTRLTSTDPYWVHYDTVDQESLYRIESGPYEGEGLIAASFGLSPLLPGLAGALIAPDHPPAHDTELATRMLTAGWAAVERGLPFEA